MGYMPETPSFLWWKRSWLYVISRSLTRGVGPPVFSASAASATRMCFHTLSQSFLSVPCSRVVTILHLIWPLLWSCMILATCSKQSQASSPSSRPRRILWAAGGRCLVVVGPCRVVLGALLVGRGAPARVLEMFSSSSAVIASFAISSSLSPRVCSVKLSSSSSLSLSESDSLDY